MRPGDPEREDRGAALERLIARALREQPLRRAPHMLESRVLHEIERRAALPWWQRGCAQWPLAARIAFLASGCLSVALVLLASSWLAAWLASARIGTVAHQISEMRAMVTAMAALAELGARLIHAIPHDWLYRSLLVAFALYLALFGLAAAAYRTLGVGAEAAEAHRP